MKTNKKIIKDIVHKSIDASFEFVCPVCNNTHWIFLREVQLKKFKIACECGSVLIPKQVKKLKTLYTTQKISKSTDEAVDKNIDIYAKCGTILGSYGYSDTEIQEMLNIAVAKLNTTDIKEIIKYCITFLGAKYV